MEAADKWLYEYALVRYVPDADRGEFVNIGLIMMCKRRRWIKAEILLNPERIKTLFPLADLEALKCQVSLFERTDVPEAGLPVEEKFRWLTAVKSAAIRVSPSHPGIFPLHEEDEGDPSFILEGEFNRLFSKLVVQPQ